MGEVGYKALEMKAGLPGDSIEEDVVDW